MCWRKSCPSVALSWLRSVCFKIRSRSMQTFLLVSQVGLMKLDTWKIIKDTMICEFRFGHQQLINHSFKADDLSGVAKAWAESFYTSSRCFCSCSFKIIVWHVWILSVITVWLCLSQATNLKVSVEDTFLGGRKPAKPISSPHSSLRNWHDCQDSISSNVFVLL